MIKLSQKPASGVRIAQRLNVRENVRFASSLAAALLDGLFEQLIELEIGLRDSWDIPSFLR